MLFDGRPTNSLAPLAQSTLTTSEGGTLIIPFTR